MKPIYYESTVENWRSIDDEHRAHGSIFLAGPTPRGESGSMCPKSWRPDALKALAEFGFGGMVFIPEWGPNHAVAKDSPGVTKEDIWEWEQTALEAAHVIAFWVPRERQHMPALTTNIEFGMWMMSGKCVFGAPPQAEDVGYMRYVCEKQEIRHSTTLHGVLHSAVLKNELQLRGEVRVDRRAATPLSGLDQLKHLAKPVAASGRP